MKTRMAMVALMTVTLIASSVGTGYAGGGGQGGPGGELLLQCYGVEHGGSPPHILAIDDQFTETTAERVGKLKLVCTPTDFSVVNSDVAPVQVVDGDHLTCYEVSQAHATKSVLTLTDTFGEQTVKVQGPSRFVCSLAIKECVSGCTNP
jgi:hypothetical protein